MASSPKKSRKRGLPDMIAHFPHNKPRRAEEMMIEEHKIDHEEKAYTVMDYAANCSSVFEVGREVPNLEDGNEYGIVLVNKRTGVISDVKPAHIVSFQAVYAEDLEEAIGKKKKKTIDFAKDFGVKKEEWMNAKNSLSLQFAGTKKLRMLEASKRREINENTLEEMRKTAFASEGTLLSVMNDARKEAMIDEKISLINKAESEVLPKFVNAELAKDVYPLDMFVSRNDAEECAEEVKEMWRKSREELEADGIERCVYEIYKQIQRTNQSLVACALLAGIAGSMKRLNRGMLAKEKYEEMKLPKGVLQKLRLDFLQGNWRMSKGADSIAVKQTDKERMIAHSLALAVTLSPTLTIPITPWSRVLNVNEAKMVKTLEALGCTVFNLPASDAVKYTSIRAARLLSAPKEEQGRRRFRRSM